MGFLYTISPFISSDSLPRYASMASVISDNFWLFNIYSFNPYVVREYMEFIDINFDFAFSELKLNMISYEYPDNIKGDENDILKYINSKYKLYNTPFQLEREYDVSKELVIDLISGKPKYFYFNDHAMYDSMMSTYSILSDIDNDTMLNLFNMMDYMNNANISSDIKALIIQYEEYASTIDDITSHGIEFYDNDCICIGVYILNQLKSYIKHEVDERSERDGTLSC